jgi:hypothetical protein
MIIGRLPTSLNSFGTMWGVGRGDDYSCKNVRNVRKDSSTNDTVPRSSRFTVELFLRPVQ